MTGPWFPTRSCAVRTLSLHVQAELLEAHAHWRCFRLWRGWHYGEKGGQRSPLPWLAGVHRNPAFFWGSHIVDTIFGYLSVYLSLQTCFNHFGIFWPCFLGFILEPSAIMRHPGRRSLVILVKIAVCKWCVNAYPSWSDIPRHTSCRQWIRPLTGAESGAGRLEAWRRRSTGNLLLDEHHGRWGFHGIS